MAFPTTLDSFTTKTDGVTDVLAADINSIQTAVSALETKVGVDGSAVAATLDKKVADLIAQAAGTAGRFVLFSTITTTNASWAKQAATTKIVVCCVGGGSAGGGSLTSTTWGFGGGKGSTAWGFASSAAATYSATIGAGGTGVMSGTGNAGGATSFGAVASATGGIAKGVTSATALDAWHGTGESNLTQGGAYQAAGGAAPANSGAGGGGSNGAASAGGAGGSGIIFVWEFA